MQRIAVFLLCLLLTVSVCGCSEEVTVYTVEEDGITFEVNTESGTLSDGTNTYRYEFSGDSDKYGIEIRYPNGSTYYWSQSGTSGHGGWSDDYDAELYVDGGTLCDVILQKAPAPSGSSDILAVVLLIALGLFAVLSPQTVWYLEYGWRFKDAEPSGLALTMNRIGGVVSIALGVFLAVS